MFGFLPGICRHVSFRSVGKQLANPDQLYQAHFCGLASALERNYGYLSRLLINRDSTFLTLLGEGLLKVEREGLLTFTRVRCCSPLPFHQRTVVPPSSQILRKHKKASEAKIEGKVIR